MVPQLELILESHHLEGKAGVVLSLLSEESR